jgi:hypothetical protein
VAPVKESTSYRYMISYVLFSHNPGC